MDTLFRILFWLILCRAILSWIRPSSYNRLFADVNQVLVTLTEPLLAPIRNLIPPYRLGLDFSPFIALILLDVLRDLTRSLILRVFAG